MSSTSLEARKPKIVSLKTCQGQRRYLWLHGTLVDLSEFPHLAKLGENASAETPGRSIGKAGDVERSGASAAGSRRDDV